MENEIKEQKSAIEEQNNSVAEQIETPEEKKRKRRKPTIWICLTSLFMGLNIAFSSFGIPVPGGHLYLCDTVICLAAIMLDPFAAFLVGGVGSFLGDLIFYPLPMFVSLVTHGLQAVVISVFSHYVLKKHPVAASVIGCVIGGIIMVVGYTIGKAFIYSTPEYAIIKLPYEIGQAALGIVFGPLLYHKFGIKKLVNRLTNK